MKNKKEKVNDYMNKYSDHHCIFGQGSRNEPLPCFLSKKFVNNLQTNKASVDYQFFYDIIYLVDLAIISRCIRLKEVGLLL